MAHWITSKVLPNMMINGVRYGLLLEGAYELIANEDIKLAVIYGGIYAVTTTLKDAFNNRMSVIESVSEIESLLKENPISLDRTIKRESSP